MEILYKFAAEHVAAVVAGSAAFAYALGRIDDIILFLLRYFDPQTIKDELDRLDAIIKARVDLDAAKGKPTVPAPSAPSAPSTTAPPQ